MKRGKLIALEGLDGTGKSTQRALLVAFLDARSVDVLATHEPTDGPTGQRIRTMARSGEALAPEEELAWFLEDRRVHVDTEIEPALAAGRWVVTDRYTLSSVAYQGARGLDPQEILRESEARFPLPDLAIVFTLPAADGLERVKARGGVAEPTFETLEFQQRVEAVFASLDRPYLARVDASGAVEDVAAAVRDLVEARLFPHL